MTHTATLSGQTTFTANEDGAVLVAATRQNLNLPHSCKNGAYGQCKVELISGEFEMGKHIDKAINEGEKTQGKVLLCCTTVKSDLKINVPGFNQNALPVRTLPTRIGNIEVKHDVALLKLALPKAPSFAFYAGQYTDLLLPSNISHSHSVANSPDQEGILELHIRKRGNGVCSEIIFGAEPKIKGKSVVRIKGPLDTFTLQQNNDKPMILLATGTDYAPIRSILLNLIRQNSERQIHFYWGAHQQVDLYALEEVETLIDRLKNAKFSPALSEPDSEWKGRNGCMQDVAAQNYPNLGRYEVYAYGSPEMTKNAHGLLTQKYALSENAFFYDALSPTQECILRNSYV